MKISPKNIHKPTSAKMNKIGLSLLSVSTFISGSSFATGHDVVGYIGLGVGVLGTLIVQLFE